MLTLPDKVSAGQPVRATTVNRLIDYARSITPRPSSTVGWDVRAGGATAAIIDRPRRVAAAAAADLAPLVLTLTKPPGYSDPPDGIPSTTPPVFITWGHVSNVVPDNIGEYTPSAQGKKVWLKAETNRQVGAAFRITGLTIGAGSDVPKDSESTDAPPAEAYFLLGTMSLKTEGGTTTVTLANWGGGSMALEMKAVDYVCQNYVPPTGSEGDANYSPGQEGGVKITYGLSWRKI